MELTDRVIDLAAEPPFSLGGLAVTPSIRQVRGADGPAVTVEPRVLQVLVALVRADGGVVSRDALIARCWGGRIVGEDAINRAVAKTRQLADLAAPPAFAIETIARVGYRLKPAAVVEAAPVDVSAPSTSPPDIASAASDAGLPRWRPSRRLIAAAGVAGLGAAAAGGWALTRMQPHVAPLVAVLPFENLSPDPQLGYFADGLAEDILNALARSAGLRVAARSSSFSFRGAAKAKAASALGANYLLDGSVLRDGDRLRVNVHLSDAKNVTIWSDTFDRALAQGLQLEDEIASQVAAALNAKLVGVAKTLIDPAVYDLFLKAREALRSTDWHDLARGRSMLQDVVARAPSFANAWYELAISCWRDDFFSPRDEQERAYALGRDAARRTLALDPRNGGAIALQQQLLPWYNHWAEIDAAQRKGLLLSPNDSQLLTWRGWELLNMGRLSESLDFFSRAHVLDPLEVWANDFMLRGLTYLGRFAEADAYAERLKTLWPGWGEADRLDMLITARRWPQALAVLENTPRKPALIDTIEVNAAAVRAMAGGGAADRQAAGRRCLQLASAGIGHALTAFRLLAGLQQLDEAAELARSIYLRTGSVPIDRSRMFVGAPQQCAHDQPYTHFLFHPLVAQLRLSGRIDEVFAGIGLMPSGGARPA